jgi:type I restriction enzyme S subunit
LKDDDVFVKQSSINIDYVKNNDILITSANGSSRLVGKHALIRNITEDSTVHGGFMLLAETQYPEFINASMSSQWYRIFINLYVTGGNGAIGNLNRSDLDEQVIYVPTKHEQLQIGAFFRSLDDLITLHQRKSDTFASLENFQVNYYYEIEL